MMALCILLLLKLREKMPRLEVMRIVLPDGTNQKLKKLNLSKNKKLKDLEQGNIVPPTLN